MSKSKYDEVYAKYIDHTVLKADVTIAVIDRFCDEAIEYGFASVCINPIYVKHVAKRLKGTGVKVCCVVGFPLGANTTETKCFETKEAIQNGANEIDMVIDIGALKDQKYDVFYEDIRAVVNEAHPDAIIKVIIETSALTKDEKIKACEIAQKANVDFVKTSSGFGSGGATVEDVALMKSVVGDKIEVKASTGIDNRVIADSLIKAGATRLGTSKGIKIVEGDD